MKDGLMERQDYQQTGNHAESHREMDEKWAGQKSGFVGFICNPAAFDFVCRIPQNLDEWLALQSGPIMGIGAGIKLVTLDEEPFWHKEWKRKQEGERKLYSRTLLESEVRRLRFIVSELATHMTNIRDSLKANVDCWKGIEPKQDWDGRPEDAVIYWKHELNAFESVCDLIEKELARSEQGEKVELVDWELRRLEAERASIEAKIAIRKGLA